MLTVSCHTQMWLQSRTHGRAPQNAVFSQEEMHQSQQGWCPALGESPWLHLLHHLQSSGTPRSRGQAGSDHRTAELLGKLLHMVTPCPKNPNLLTFEALPVWLKHSANAPAGCKQWELQVGQGGRASQVGGWSIPCCATLLPPAPAPMALQLFAHSQLLCHSSCTQS